MDLLLGSLWHHCSEKVTEEEGHNFWTHEEPTKFLKIPRNIPKGWGRERGSSQRPGPPLVPLLSFCARCPPQTPASRWQTETSRLWGQKEQV